MPMAGGGNLIHSQLLILQVSSLTTVVWNCFSYWKRWECKRLVSQAWPASAKRGRVRVAWVGVRDGSGLWDYSHKSENKAKINYACPEKGNLQLSNLQNSTLTKIMAITFRSFETVLLAPNSGFLFQMLWNNDSEQKVWAQQRHMISTDNKAAIYVALSQVHIRACMGIRKATAVVATTFVLYPSPAYKKNVERSSCCTQNWAHDQLKCRWTINIIKYIQQGYHDTW